MIQIFTGGTRYSHQRWIRQPRQITAVPRDARCYAERYIETHIDEFVCTAGERLGVVR